MWYVFQGLVPSLLLSATGTSDNTLFSQRFLFSPPACEYRVLFPQQPQKIGTLVQAPSTWSAQLKLPQVFMRADCTPLTSGEPPTGETRQLQLLSFIDEQIYRFGGSRLVILNIEIQSRHAKMTAQLFSGDQTILLKTHAYIGNHSMLTLTAIEHDRVRSGGAAENFMKSAISRSTWH